jgi:hypothetical protein
MHLPLAHPASSLLALALVAACASSGSAPPETVTGTFALVRIEGRLQPLVEGGGSAEPAAPCPTTGESGTVEVTSTRRFALSVRQETACAGQVRREFRGTYVRKEEYLGFEAPIPGQGMVRFQGTTNDTTLRVRLTGAELVFQRTRE